MNKLLATAALILTLTPAFAFANGDSSLEGTKIACQGGAIDFTLTIGNEIPTEKIWQTGYEGLLTGPQLYLPTKLVSQTLSTRVYAGFEMIVDFNDAKVFIKDIQYSIREDFMPVGLHGTLVGADGKTNVKLSCSYVNN